MYFADLSPFTYDGHIATLGSPLNIGWLDKDHTFCSGKVPDDFVEALWHFCETPIVQHRGFHACELCTENGPGLVTEVHRNTSFGLGSRLICVFGTDGTPYISPDLIIHYVLRHQYRPPDDYISAVVSGPRPGSHKYAILVRPFTNANEVASTARAAAVNTASRLGYFLDKNNNAVPIPEEEITGRTEISVEDLAWELMAKSHD